MEQISDYDKGKKYNFERKLYDKSFEEFRQKFKWI